MKPRSAAVAILFALFLGPIGLLYGSFWAAVVVTLLMVVLSFFSFSPVVQLVLIVLWGLCPYISVYMLQRDSKKYRQYHRSRRDFRDSHRQH